MANARDAVLVTEAEPVDAASGGPRIIYVNEAFTAMTGWTAAEAIGRTPRMLQCPGTDQRELDRLRRALARWEPVEIELRNVRKDGTGFWVQFVVVPVADADGWFTHWVSIQRDVTARRARDERLATFVEESRDLVLLVGSDGRVRAASPAAARAAGTAGGDLLGLDLLSVLHPDARPAAARSLAVTRDELAAGAPLELRARVAAGWRWYEVSVRHATIGGDPVAVVTATDVTARRHERHELRVARERLRAAFVDAPIGMGVVGSDGAVLAVNPRFCRLVGRDEHALLGSVLDELVHPDDRDASRLERAGVLAGTVAVARRETRLVHADGRVVGVMLSSSVVRRGGAASELVVHAEDISDRKALEAHLTHQALHDHLTALPNRTLFLDRLTSALLRAGRSDAPVSVLFLDVDDFKAVNDAHGHGTGDRVLAAVAGRILAVLRPGDTAARFGGDEFTVLCEGTDAAGARRVADRLARSIARPVALPGGGELALRASIGVATTAGDRCAPEQLLHDADTAMYAAKHGAAVPLADGPDAATGVPA